MVCPAGTIMKLTAVFIGLLTIIFLPLACSKTGGIPPPPPPDPCISLNLTITGTITNPSATGAADGSINASATGGTGFTYCVNNGTWQSTGYFKNLLAGVYSVTAKNSEGCISSFSFTLLDPVYVCAGVNVILALTSTSNIPCEATNTASISVTASGGVAPYTYSMDGGSFQAGNTFYDVTSAGHTITAKDANGCSGTGSITVGNAVAGPLFTQVRTLIRNNCLYCHGTLVASGGVSYADDCNIVTGKQRVKARAVDGNPSPMPQTGLLPAAERQKIIDWINAGGKFSD